MPEPEARRLERALSERDPELLSEAIRNAVSNPRSLFPGAARVTVDRGSFEEHGPGVASVLARIGDRTWRLLLVDEGGMWRVFATESP
jgi:hypothetical protein